MHSIQHVLGKNFEISSINYFKKGLFIRANHCEVLVESDDYLSAVQVKVGVPEEFCDESNDKELKGECEEVLWKAFHDAVVFKVAENNDSVQLTKRIISWNGLKLGQNVFYAFDKVIQHHNLKKTVIHHTALDDEKHVYDRLDALLTKREIKVNISGFILYHLIKCRHIALLRSGRDV